MRNEGVSEIESIEVARPTVSVVIPTRGRPKQVHRAVASALGQSYRQLEVIVVVDGPDVDTATILQSVDDARLRVVALPTSRGAGGARNAGVEHALGTYVAFLDDDDTWRPTKIAQQLEALFRVPHQYRTVVSCAAYWHFTDHTVVWPTRAPAEGERVGDYLFLRDHAGEGMLATPTLLLSRDLALHCPMPTHLRTHEEWDWMLDLERAGATFRVLLQPLVDVDARSERQSVSTGADWRLSTAWACVRATDLGPRAFSGFVLNEAARAAVMAGAGVRVYAALGAMALTGRARPRDILRFAGRPVALARRARSSRRR